MAKRFTDNEKWKDAWFMDLPSKYKLFWIYLLDDCDHAGIWKVNFKVASFYVGEHLEPSEVKRIIKERITFISDEYWYINKFIKFQYKVEAEQLNSNSNVHKSVIKRLKEYNLINPSVTLAQPLSNPCASVKDKDKDIDSYIINIKTENSFIDGLYMKYKLRKGTIPVILIKFKEHLKVFPTNYNNFSEFKTHFANWIGLEIRKGNLSNYVKGFKKGDL